MDSLGRAVSGHDFPGEGPRPAEAVISSDRADDRCHFAFIAALDLQVLLGLSMYLLLSPLGRPLWGRMGDVLHDHVLRFWVVEHATGMLTALALAHLGNVRTKRAPDASSRRRRRIAWTAWTLLFIVLSIPWPFLRYGRSMLRWPP